MIVWEEGRRPAGSPLRDGREEGGERGAFLTGLSNRRPVRLAPFAAAVAEDLATNILAQS